MKTSLFAAIMILFKVISTIIYKTKGVKKFNNHSPLETYKSLQDQTVSLMGRSPPSMKAT